jgi:hypothetical protein
MVDATPFLPGLSSVQGKAMVARFDGGRLSSEGGLLARQAAERDSARRFTDMVPDLEREVEPFVSRAEGRDERGTL